MENQTGQTTKELAVAVIDTIKTHPVPSIMIGSGLAWLLATGFYQQLRDTDDGLGSFIEKRKKGSVNKSGTFDLGFIERRRSSQDESLGARFSRKAQQAKAAVRQGAQEVKNKSVHWGDQAREEALKTGEQGKQIAQELRSALPEYGRRTGEIVKTGVTKAMQGNPWAIAGTAWMAGLVAGFIVHMAASRK